jgi:hypothetical protein
MCSDAQKPDIEAQQPPKKTSSCTNLFCNFLLVCTVLCYIFLLILIFAPMMFGNGPTPKSNNTRTNHHNRKLTNWTSEVPAFSTPLSDNLTSILYWDFDLVAGIRNYPPVTWSCHKYSPLPTHTLSWLCSVCDVHWEKLRKLIPKEVTPERMNFAKCAVDCFQNDDRLQCVRAMAALQPKTPIWAFLGRE